MNPYSTYPPYTRPFRPDHFYLVPVQWLQHVKQPSEFDSLFLLMSAHPRREPAELLLFSDEQPESYWTRSNPDNLPNLVSHPTYYALLHDLQKQGWLSNCDANPLAKPQDDLLGAEVQPLDHSGCYRMIFWPEMGGDGFVYVPRPYIQHRWSKIFQTNQDGLRGALLGCLGSLTQQLLGVDPPQVEVELSRRQIHQAAQELLPTFSQEHKIGDGIRSLAELGLLDEIRQTGSNRWYRVRADAFNEPPQWPVEKIATQCQLDPDTQRVWIDLVQAFLRCNYDPLEECSEVWRIIRKHPDSMATDDDARRLMNALKAKAGNSSVSPGTILSDDRKKILRQEGRYWVESPKVALSIQGALTRAEMPISMPLGAAEDSLHSVRVFLTFEPGPRLSILRTRELAQHLALWLFQGDRAWRVTSSLRLDPWAVGHYLSVDLPGNCRQDLDLSQPIRLILEWTNESPWDTRTQLTIYGRIRAVYRSQPAPWR